MEVLTLYIFCSQWKIIFSNQSNSKKENWDFLDNFKNISLKFSTTGLYNIIEVKFNHPMSIKSYVSAKVIFFVNNCIGCYLEFKYASFTLLGKNGI